MAGALGKIIRWTILNNGVPVPGAKLYTYLSGTSTPSPVYTTSALNVEHPNPLVADAAGDLPVFYFGARSYRYIVKDADDVTLIPAQDGVYDFAQIGTLGNITVGTITASGLGTFEVGIATDTVAEETPAAGVTVDGVLLKDGGVNIAGALTNSGQIVFPATQNASANANTLDDYEEGSFTGTLTGVSGTVTVTVTYTKTGNQVTVDVPLLAGTSNATTKTLTGMPAAVRPAANRGASIFSSDNGGALIAAQGILASSGVLTLYPNAAAGTWTGSGSMQINAFQMSYTLA